MRFEVTYINNFVASTNISGKFMIFYQEPLLDYLIVQIWIILIVFVVQFKIFFIIINA